MSKRRRIVEQRVPVYRGQSYLGSYPMTRVVSLAEAGKVSLEYNRKDVIVAARQNVSRSEPAANGNGTALGGTAYSYEETLDVGRAWELRKLGRYRYAPDSARPLFEVVLQSVTR